MKKFSLSIKIYFGLILLLTILATVNIFLPQGSFLPAFQEKNLPSKPIMALVNGCIILVLYGCLGFIGLIVSKKIGFADIWDQEVSNKQRFLIPAIVGIGIGTFLILTDLFLSRFHELGPLPHPPFPTSLIASATAGIGEEVIFRLFFISFWVWLISHIILKGRWQKQIFWIVTIVSAILFAFGHIPSVMILFRLNSVSQMPLALMIEIILLNGVISLFAAYFFKKYGFLAAVGIHFWTDIIWHVIWGIF